MSADPGNVHPAIAGVGRYRRWSLQEVDDWVAPQVLSSVVLGLVGVELEHFQKFNTDTFVAVLDHAQNQVLRRHKLSVSFDESWCDFAITHLNFVLLLFVNFVKDQLLMGAPESLSSSLNESNEILRTCLFANPKPYWANTEADLNYLAALLATADAGGDWKSLVKVRPQVIRSASNA